MTKKLFLTEYLKNIRTVGAVAPSSRFLATKMLSGIDFANAKLIVEYGPGTGIFTSGLVKRMDPRTKLLVLEVNKSFYLLLKKKYENHKNIEVINDSAANVIELLHERQLPAPDYIISGLPFAALPGEVSKAILADTVKLLGDKGSFITFQYTLLKRQLFESYFNNLQISREVRNLPPAYVFRCDNSHTNI